MKDKVCPLMSCRTTSATTPGAYSLLTPTVAKCQKGDCALWDSANKACVFVSLLIETIKGNGQ